ncbi:chromobox protein, putative [Entamoeba invadens IP1]|uniref:chromobox protein, putative n=1 Tax=Entamoeba invadens IP1 TaxID=370355 RepID=UPI0002C3D4DB|nr:chromobox protein, putative [Entamoeba invadens IP1]ELP90414.1 chromobox protein, putative [Entamoeba invadens IP1]|eukprot:XP_004257185.1 chromobox protein, putative [Entamoeba invadens IP1]
MKCITNKNTAVEATVGTQRTISSLREYITKEELFENTQDDELWSFMSDDETYQQVADYKTTHMTFQNTFVNEGALALDATYKEILSTLLPIDKVCTSNSLYIFGVEFFVVDSSLNTISKTVNGNLTFDGSNGMLCVCNIKKFGHVFNVKLNVNDVNYNVEPLTAEMIPVSKNSVISLCFQPLIEWKIGTEPNYYPISAPPQINNISFEAVSVISPKNTISDFVKNNGWICVAKTIEAYVVFSSNSTLVVDVVEIPFMPHIVLEVVKTIFAKRGITGEKILIADFSDIPAYEFKEGVDLYESALCGTFKKIPIFVVCSCGKEQSLAHPKTIVMRHANIPFRESSLTLSLELKGVGELDIDNVFHPFVKKNIPTQSTKYQNPITPATSVNLKCFEIDDTISTTADIPFGPSEIELKVTKEEDTGLLQKPIIKQKEAKEKKQKKTTKRQNKRKEDQENVTVQKLQESLLEQITKNNYEVEKIVKKRTTKKGTEYFVKWKGYGCRENTWETQKNMEKSYKEMIAQFEKDATKPKKPENELSEKGKVFDVWKQMKTLNVLYAAEGKERSILSLEAMRKRNPQALLDFFIEKMICETEQRKEE